MDGRLTVSEPSPPMTTSLEIRWWTSVRTAFFIPSHSLNSSHRAVPITVPPCARTRTHGTHTNTHTRKERVSGRALKGTPASAGGKTKSAHLREDARDVAPVHLDDLVVEQALVALADGVHPSASL
jgi:hypothetical protein